MAIRAQKRKAGKQTTSYDTQHISNCFSMFFFHLVLMFRMLLTLLPFGILWHIGSFCNAFWWQLPAYMS